MICPFTDDEVSIAATSAGTDLAGIAAKGAKESRYHVRHAGEWLLRLGDGTGATWTGQTAFMITHDVDEAIYLADKIFLRDLLAKHQLPQTAAELNSRKLDHLIRLLEAECPIFHGLGNFVTDLLPGVNPAFKFWTSPTAVPAPFPVVVTSNSGAPLDQNLYQAVKGVSFEVRQGELVSLIGANGAGKTTTLKAISGLLPLEVGEVRSGAIRFQGESIEHVAPHLLAYVLSFVYVGIYWNNHHHLLHAAQRISGPILWANLNLLFWLSLVPFTTAWLGSSGFRSAPVATFGAGRGTSRT